MYVFPLCCIHRSAHDQIHLCIFNKSWVVSMHVCGCSLAVKEQVASLTLNVNNSSCYGTVKKINEKTTNYSVRSNINEYSFTCIKSWFKKKCPADRVTNQSVMSCGLHLFHKFIQMRMMHGTHIQYFLRWYIFDTNSFYSMSSEDLNKASCFT